MPRGKDEGLLRARQQRTFALASESLDAGDAIGRQAQNLSRKCAPAQGKIRDKTTGSCSSLPEPESVRGSTQVRTMS